VLLLPVFNTPVQRLEEAVESVLTQAYEHWELVLVDDGSTDADLLRTLPGVAARDRRMVLAKLEGHEGISGASNRGLALAHGEWVTFLDHDDVLEPDALFQVVKPLADVDLCLKMRRAGYLVVYTPFVKLYWHDTQPGKGDMAGQAIMEQRWAGVLQRDPYYNPNLSRERADFSLGK
jgi:glycosyltransferase involved in cell wall biosynthesis